MSHRTDRSVRKHVNRRPHSEAQQLLEAMGREQARVMRERAQETRWRPGLAAPVEFDVYTARRIAPDLKTARPAVVRDRYRKLVERGEVVEMRGPRLHWRLAR